MSTDYDDIPHIPDDVLAYLHIVSPAVSVLSTAHGHLVTMKRTIADRQFEAQARVDWIINLDQFECIVQQLRARIAREIEKTL